MLVLLLQGVSVGPVHFSLVVLALHPVFILLCAASEVFLELLFVSRPVGFEAALGLLDVLTDRLVLDSADCRPLYKVCLFVSRGASHGASQLYSGCPAAFQPQLMESALEAAVIYGYSPADEVLYKQNLTAGY